MHKNSGHELRQAVINGIIERINAECELELHNAEMRVQRNERRIREYREEKGWVKEWDGWQGY
jgi:hypothetical protein